MLPDAGWIRVGDTFRTQEDEMRLVAHFFYGVAALALLFVVWLSVALANEYGWDLRGTVETLPIVAVLVGTPVWIGTLFHRRARRGIWID